jgi:uncharacterized damage-inducible protein DinB
VSLTYRLEELLRYSDHERGKWRGWIAADPARLQIPVQPGGRFPTVWSLLDHVFLVERRQLARLEGATPPDRSGIADGDWAALFEYGELVRSDFRAYVSRLDDAAGADTVPVVLASGTFTMRRRRLAMHVFLHETRHLAQMAQAARLAGVEPPGSHDLFYFTDFD